MATPAGMRWTDHAAPVMNRIRHVKAKPQSSVDTLWTDARTKFERKSRRWPVISAQSAFEAEIRREERDNPTEDDNPGLADNGTTKGEGNQQDQIVSKPSCLATSSIPSPTSDIFSQIDWTWRPTQEQPKKKRRTRTKRRSKYRNTVQFPLSTAPAPTSVLWNAAYPHHHNKMQYTHHIYHPTPVRANYFRDPDQLPTGDIVRKQYGVSPSAYDIHFWPFVNYQPCPRISAQSSYRHSLQAHPTQRW